MASTRSWLRLPLPSSSDLPVLLASLDIGAADYTIHVTDMANMWTESLDRKAICIRGWSENTSIDPSDTAENMFKFLTSLRAALDSSHPDHDGTRLDLALASKPDSSDGELTLKITCDLPGLPPLKWPMSLKKSPPSTIATGLVLPLIEAHLTRNREVESLVRTTEYKDTIISKLLDKLEAMGTGLEHVFNPLSGRKKVTRATAEDKIPGLAPFNRRRWKSDLDNQDDGPNNADTLISEVFGKEGLQYQDVLRMDESPRLDTWWHNFKGASHKSRRSQTEAATPEETPLAEPEKSFEGEDDDFQVQSTPPRLRATGQSANSKQKDESAKPLSETKRNPPAPQHDAADSTPDAHPKPKPEAKKPSTRLGSLGRKKQWTPVRSPSPVQAASRVQESPGGDDESETASEAEGDGATRPHSAESHDLSLSPPRKMAPKKGGLGRIGGPKSKPPSKEVSKTPEPEGASSSNQTSTHPVHKKLGVIGKKPDASTTRVKTEEDEPRDRAHRGSRSREVETTPKPRETSQERADRKRVELKRDLEKKAAAGPVKKKRKF